MANQQPQVAQKQQPKHEFGRTYLVRLRQHIGGSFNNGLGFSGLWELSLMTPKGNVEKVISDADTLTNCLENFTGEMEKEGY